MSRKLNYLLMASTSACAIFVGAQPAVAREEPTALPEVVVTGTRAVGGVDPAKVGSSLTLISPEMMEQRQVRLISDVLRDVPGVSVSRSGAVGNLTQVRIRGSEGNQVLTLIDGIEASDPFYGEFDFGLLIAEDDARLEVMRGQQSAIYGSDAIGGVINYITATGAEAPGARLRVEGGSFGTVAGAARIAGSTSRLDYAFSSALQSVGGYPTATEGTRDIGSEIAVSSAKVSWQVSDSLILRAVGRVSQTTADTNGQDYATGYIIDTPGSYFVSKAFHGLVGADLALLEGRWNHSLTLQGVDADRDDHAKSGRVGGDEGGRLKGTYTSTIKLVSGNIEHRFTGSLDVERETFQNTEAESPYGADTTRRSMKNLGAVGQYDLLMENTAGVGVAVRHDDNDIFQSADTYRVHGFWRAADHLRLRAAAGSGIKNPSQTELFGYNAAAYPFAGNPNLKPERSEGWEVGFDTDGWNHRIRLGATYFNSNLKDEIFTDYAAMPALCGQPGMPAPGSCSTPGNRTTRSTQEGVEMFAAGRILPTLRLDVAYTYLEAVENGVEEIRRPPHIASLNLAWSPSDQWNATLSVRHNGQTKDQDFSTYPATVRDLDAFTLVNLAGAWKVSDRFELFGRIENLADQEYEEVLHVRSAGRAAYAGLTAHF